MIILVLKKVIFSVSFIIVGLLILSLLPILLVFRKYLQHRIARNRTARLGKGFNLLEAISIGGLKQWISVRGENKDNPMLLVLHGGPGISMMPYSTIFHSLESKFTIVQWDQRGAGKTYSSNKRSLFINTITIDRIQADTLELVNYLRQQFNKEKIFVLGCSWGTILGLKLAQDHPELLHAYIGSGQVVNMKINEKTGYENTLKRAHEKNNIEAIKELEDLTPFQNNLLTDLTMKEFTVLRKWEFALYPIQIKKLTLISIIINGLSVPEYSLLDYVSLVRGAFILSKSKALFAELMNVALEDKTNYSTSIYIFGGRNDALTPSLPVYEYFQNIQAPRKEYFWFEDSGHNLLFEERDKFVGIMSQLASS